MATRTKLPIPTEHQEQATFIDVCERLSASVPALGLVFAIPNGGQRNVVVARKLKAEGVRPGVPDLFLPVARGIWHGLFIEMKRRDGGELKPTQRRVHRQLLDQNYDVRVCLGWKDAVRTALTYLGYRPEDYLR